MQLVKDKEILRRFDAQLYETSPLFITSDMFWDGGIRTDSSLREKAEFYALAEKMSAVVQDFILLQKEDVFMGQPFCEDGKLYAHWSDLKQQTLFREISAIIKKNKCYQLSLPEDKNVVDLIVESNFRYFTYVSLYLPASNIILQPTCHTEIVVYSQHNQEIKKTLQGIVEKYSTAAQEIRVK